MIYGLISARTLEINGESCIVGAVREEERANISREILDDLGQLLTGLKRERALIVGGTKEIRGKN